MWFHMFLASPRPSPKPRVSKKNVFSQVFGPPTSSPRPRVSKNLVFSQVFGFPEAFPEASGDENIVFSQVFGLPEAFPEASGEQKPCVFTSIWPPRGLPRTLNTLNYIYLNPPPSNTPSFRPFLCFPWPGLAWPRLASPGFAWPRLVPPGLAWFRLASPGLALLPKILVNLDSEFSQNS